MQYTRLFITLFFWVPMALSHAETKVGAIKDAEFVIEKQKKNTVNQAQRLFFKAPIPTIKTLNKPLKILKETAAADILFDPAPQLYLPFSLQTGQTPPAFNRYARIGISSLCLPYLEVGLDNYSLGHGIWSIELAFVPALWDKKAKEASLALQGSYGIGAWILQPKLDYQYGWHKYSDASAYTCGLHQGAIGLLGKQAGESFSQDGCVDIKTINYRNENIHEQLCILKHKWVKQLDNWSFNLGSYVDIAGYTNDTAKQKRYIFSVTPGLYVDFYQSIKLKVRLRMAYHNDAISGKIPNFDLYPMVKLAYAKASWLVPYIGIKGMGVGGSVVPLHLHDLVSKNPFIDVNCKLSHAHQYFTLYGGSQGIVSPNLSYHLHIAYRQRKNQSRIVWASQHKITLRYNSANYNLLKAVGLIEYGIGKLRATIKGSYYKYFEDSSAPIWWYHKPSYKLKPTLTYKPHEKVLLTGNLHLYGATKIKDLVGTATDVGSMIDLSLGVDYCIFERFVGFLMVGNLLNRKDRSYSGYPGKKINLTAGLAYRW